MLLTVYKWSLLSVRWILLYVLLKLIFYSSVLIIIISLSRCEASQLMVRFWSSTSDSAITTIHWPYPLCGFMTLYDNGFPQFCFSLEITMNENKAYKQGRNITWHAAAHWIDVGENPTWNSFPNLATTIAFEILSTMLIILYLIGEKKKCSCLLTIWLQWSMELVQIQ